MREYETPINQKVVYISVGERGISRRPVNKRRLKRFLTKVFVEKNFSGRFFLVNPFIGLKM